MGKASKVMYIIGRVFNIIEIVMSILTIVGGIIVLTMPNLFTGTQLPSTQLNAIGLGLIIGGIIALLVSIIVLALATNAQNSLNNGAKENGPHIIMLVIGLLSGDVFYTLGAIFGLVSENV